MRMRGLASVLLVLPLAALAAETLTVTNDEHRIEILRVERHDTLMDGMLWPEDPEETFLLVYLETDDPCLDPLQAASCFGDEVEPEEKLAWACGRVMLGEGEERRADGGGILDGELACSYVVPRASRRLVLEIRGYPQVELQRSLAPAEARSPDG